MLLRGNGRWGRKGVVRSVGITTAFLFLAILPWGTRTHAGDIEWNDLALARGADLVADEPESARTDSAVVKLPFAVTLREPSDGRVGFKLRIPVYFSWYHTKLTDIEGDDITRSLQTLVVTPGIEVLIPVDDHWMIRPFAEFGAISALNLGENAWLGAAGVRASASWRFPEWRLITGGRLRYTIGWTDDWAAHDDVAFIELGAGAAVPLWFTTLGDRPFGGIFVAPRRYFDNLFVEGPGDASFNVSYHVEVGISFELPQQSKLLGVRLPAWYGVGYRFAPDFGAWRIYLGFPF